MEDSQKNQKRVWDAFLLILSDLRKTVSQNWKISACRLQWSIILSDLDIDKDGNITYQEFKRHVEDSVVREALGVRETTTIDDIGDL